MLVEAELDLDERTPLGPLGFADQVHAGFLRRSIGLERITIDAGANDVLPGSGTAAITGNDVVQIQVFAIKNSAAILAGVLVALEDVVPGELNLFLGQMIVNHQQDHARNANAKRNRPNRFRIGLLLGKVVPLGKPECLEGAIRPIKDSLGVSLEQQSQGSPGGANIDRLP